MRVSFLALLLVDVVLLSVLASCGSNSQKPQLPPPLDKAIVTVGVKTLPSFYENIHGNEDGFEASARKKILEYAGVEQSTPTEVWPNNWESQLTEGNMDLAMGMISDSDPRASKVLFAQSYLKTDIGLLTLASFPDFKYDSQLSGKRICTVKETSADSAILTLQKKDPSIVSVNGSSGAECIEKLGADADAYSTDRLILMGFSTDQGNIDDDTKKSRYRVHSLSVGRDQHISIALNKKDSQACQRLVDAIKKYVSNEWLTDLRREVIDEYLERAPDAPSMTDEEVKRKFQPTVNDADRCTDPPLANTSN